ncbi:hypothetical protein TNCV_2527831 [Trichonephila clavipes]|nr:hypothetical protein TNCV_2527831 [Trichonephila clavipes]
MTATAGSDVVQSGRPIFDDFFQHLWPYIGNNTGECCLPNELTQFELGHATGLRGGFSFRALQNGFRGMYPMSEIVGREGTASNGLGGYLTLLRGETEVLHI